MKILTNKTLSLSAAFVTAGLSVGMLSGCGGDETATTTTTTDAMTSHSSTDAMTKSDDAMTKSDAAMTKTDDKMMKSEDKMSKSGDSMKKESGKMMKATTADVPKFTATLLDGSTFKSTQIKAKTVVHVFASWCPNCQAEAPGFAKFQKANPDLNYVYINVADKSADATAFMKEHGFADGPVINDPKREIAGKFGLSGQPNTVIVPASGKLTKLIGPASEEKLAEAVASLN